MEKLITLWEGSGLYNLTTGEFAMILVGFGLLYLAIRKQFEPLLLVPIGFGGILANIPQAGLAFSAIEQALHVANPVVVQAISEALGSVSATPDQLYSLYHEANAATRTLIGNIVADAGYFKRYPLSVLQCCHWQWGCSTGYLYGCGCYDGFWSVAG